MKKVFNALVLLSFLLLGTNTAWSVTADWKLVVRVKGVVESLFSGETNWERIWQSRMLRDGDKARTGADSRANIRLADNSIVVLGANTEVEISKFQISDQSRNVEFKLFNGKMRNTVGSFRGKDSRFEVKTPNAVMAARGTEFYVEYEPQSVGDGNRGGTTRLIVFTNSVEITAGGVTKIITAGNSAQVGPTGGIVINPPGVEMRGPSSPPSMIPDIDLIEYQPAPAPSVVHQIPYDPQVPQQTIATGGKPDSPPLQPSGTVVPPPGNTGSVIIIIK